MNEDTAPPAKVSGGIPKKLVIKLVVVKVIIVAAVAAAVIYAL